MHILLLVITVGHGFLRTTHGTGHAGLNSFRIEVKPLTSRRY